MHCLFPILLPVSHDRQTLAGRQRKAFLSDCARQAVRMSAEKAGIRLARLATDENGCPVPENGCYWSLSHKPSMVAGVVAPFSVGIDVEVIRPVSEKLFEKIADDGEWQLMPAGAVDKSAWFFRFWTAKEAVVKAVGGRYADIFRCRITQIIDGDHLHCDLAGRSWAIEHRYFNGHIAAVLHQKMPVCWGGVKGCKV
ncbi:MAG: 4'-phosphopantetheinyl transferase family protein [Thermodesulfobacteriota bacterium]